MRNEPVLVFLVAVIFVRIDKAGGRIVSTLPEGGEFAMGFLWLFIESLDFIGEMMYNNFVYNL